MLIVLTRDDLNDQASKFEHIDLNYINPRILRRDTVELAADIVFYNITGDDMLDVLFDTSNVECKVLKHRHTHTMSLAKYYKYIDLFTKLWNT